MINEWSNKNWFNSFNSAKGLLYSKWYQAIRDWKDGLRDKPLAPIEASLDPINVCSLRCHFCNASRYLLNLPKDKMIRLPDEHYINLIKFLSDWGVLAICHGGGGEPTLHTKLVDALLTAKDLGMDNSIATNGIHFDDKLIETSANTCRWIGISVDSATADIYKLLRGEDYFNKTITTIKKLSKYVKDNKLNCDIAYKFLIYPENMHEIYNACKLAKDLGALTFHARPCDLYHQGISSSYKNKKLNYDIDLILEQFDKCHQLEDDNFKVFTIVHKFDTSFKPLKNFSQCYASPCCIQLCPSGEVFLCPDQRYNDFYKLGYHYPKPEQILDFWGNKRHYDLVFNIGKDNCNTRCTFQPYCKQCEELFIKDTDPMCWKFI